MMELKDKLEVDLPVSTYRLLKDLHLLRDEVSLDDPTIEPEDWINMNKQLEMVADSGVTTELTSEQYDHLASGKAASTTITRIVENFLTVDGLPFDFSDRLFLKGLFDYFPKYSEGCKNTFLHCSRQTGKSTTQSSKACALGIANPAYKTLYVAPRYDQVIIFSQQRFKPMCEDSEIMMRTYVNPGKNLWQVKARQFSNGAFFNFRSCYLSADNARGISANHLMIDEIQDFVPDAIPVLEECQAQSDRDLRYRLYAGTPKTTANIITQRWENSCKFTWLIKCTHCNYSENMCDEDIIQNDKYACVKCGGEIWPKVHGRWVPLNPSLLDKCWGFHLSQIMMPNKEHRDIIERRDDPSISRGTYLNETLGIAYDDGEAGISEASLKRACKDYELMTPEQIGKASARGARICAGVDYGTGQGANPSYTVLIIGQWQLNGRFKVLYHKKFIGRESDTLVSFNLIDQICKTAGVHAIGADWGHGSHQNMRLSRERGWSRWEGERVLMEFCYTNQKTEWRWDGKAERYSVDRNRSIERVMDAVRKCDETEGIIFPRWEDIRDIKTDLMALHLEYNERTGNYSYQHILPDDAFHALSYAYMAARQWNGLALRSSDLPS